MAEFVYLNPFLSVNGNDLSDHLTDCAVNWTQELEQWVNAVPVGTVSFQRRLPGVQDFAIDPKFNDDFASNKVHATFYGMLGSAGVTVIFKPQNTTVSSTNPSFTATMVSDGVTIGGPVGKLATKSPKLMIASGVVTVATS